ncbi:MAG: CsbD family protein [Xenococcaceae cyanobacterium MO_188.B32]|nr:CsbD family protein [Xenococcaceae cyanobacterium MO_188.B32]
MFSLKTDSDSLLTSYVNKLLVVAIVLVLSVFVWLRPFTSVHNVAHAEVISDLPSVVAIAGVGDKVEGKVEEDIGTVQRNVGQVTGQTEGALKQAKGKAKQDIGETKNALDNAADKAEDASESFIDSVKDFFNK